MEPQVFFEEVTLTRRRRKTKTTRWV